jgi:hypothetical protein
MLHKALAPDLRPEDIGVGESLFEHISQLEEASLKHRALFP